MADKTTATQGSQGASSFPSRLGNAISAKQEAAGKLRARAIAGKRSPKVAGKEASPSARSPEGETGQSISPMAEQVEMVPPLGEGLGLPIPAPPGTAGPLGSEATFTPTAAQGVALTQQMQLFISQAVAQAVASNLHQRARPESIASETPSHSNVSYLSQAEAATYQGPVSPVNSSRSFTGDDEQRELGLSEDEDLPPDPPAFTCLFNKTLFKSLLHKARSTAQLRPEVVPEAEPSTSQGPTSMFCSEPTFTQQDIPCPPLFLSEVQKQWETPGIFKGLPPAIKNLFNVAPSLSEVLEVPTVDEPLPITFSPNFIMSGDISDVLTPEEKRAELNFRRTHEASAWAVKAAFWAERSPVHVAARRGEIHQLQELIRNGACVNLVIYDSVTPLHEASLRGQTRYVEILLAAGAQVGAEGTRLQKERMPEKELPCGSLSFVVSASVKLSAEQRWKRSPTSTSL